jgi:TonB family protein
MELLLYLAKVGILYSLLYLIYFSLFRNNTNFQANRIYLLVIIPIAFLVPFLNTSVNVASDYQVTLPAFEIGEIANQTSSFNWESTILYFYIFISGILLTVLFANIFKTLQTISNIKKGEINDVKPFSFFSFIYASKNIEKADRMAIIHHEQVHSTHLHSIDIIVYELCKTLLWWNPFLWMGLKSVKSNHEFIADKLASEKADKYSSVLVAQLLGVNCSVLANNFNYEPLIKKRIMMMKTKKSNRLSILKYALVIPIVTIAIVATTNKKVIADPIENIVQKGDDKVYNKADVMPEFKGGIEALMTYLGNNINYPEEAKQNKDEGKVYVSFVIDKKGKIKETIILRSVTPLLDNEAKRVIEGMPKWKPGKNDGKKVNVKYTIPINFKLNE